MSVQKLASGRFRARVKSGRVEVASRVFDLKRDAEAWEAAQRRALDLGDYVDPRAGKETLESAWIRWQEARENAVSGKTFVADGTAWRHIPPRLRKRPIAAITAAQFDALWSELLGGLSRGTVVRFRAVLGTFFTWASRQKLVTKNPALESIVPKGRGTTRNHEVSPLTIDQLREVHRLAIEQAGRASGDIVLVLGLSGLRWGELAALRVRDVQARPIPTFRVVRSKSDGQELRWKTKGGKPRTVPLVDEAWAIVAPLLPQRGPEDLVFPSRVGTFRDLANWKRDVRWDTIAHGRRVHDLRHTAATFWLGQGVDLKTVQTWLGHSTATLTADTYAHFMGSGADIAAVRRLNAVLDAPNAPAPPALDI